MKTIYVVRSRGMRSNHNVITETQYTNKRGAFAAAKWVHGRVYVKTILAPPDDSYIELAEIRK